MINIERLVQEGKQRLVEVLGRPVKPVIPVRPVIPCIPQAEGDEKDRLTAYANELVIAETFSHQSFANFVMTMRGLVGLAEPERPNVPSNGFPAKRLGIKGYLEFNGEGDAANIAIVREEFKYRHDFGRRSLFLEQCPEPNGFDLKMATWPAYSSDIPDIERLLNTDGINFIQDTNPPYNGKGGIIWTRASLSENIVQNFCRKIVEQVQTLPPGYTFVPGEVIDKRNGALKRFTHR